MYVLDATPLIYLAKAGRLELLGEFAEARSPEAVYDEVVCEGIEAGYADARRVERAVEDGLITVVSVEPTDTLDRLDDNDALSETDAAVLALAESRGATAVIDEAHGRAVADAEGIQTRGTAYLVLRCLREGAIDAEAARATIDAMLEAGWYCSPDLYATIQRRIDDLA
jgi:predicted nucleic acid-binding protein